MKADKLTNKPTPPHLDNLSASKPFLQRTVTYSSLLALIIPLLAIVIVAGFMIYRWFIVATVNGAPITRFEYYNLLEQQGSKEILDVLISEMLIQQAAQKQGLVVEQTEVDQEIAKIEEDVMADNQSLDEILAMQGMTRDSLMQQIKLNKMVEKMAIDTLSEPSDEEVAEYLANNGAIYGDMGSPEEQLVAAKEDLENQNKRSAYQTWMQNIRDTANIVYKAGFNQ